MSSRSSRSRGDLTQGPVVKTLLAFSLPMLLTNVLQSLNGTINSIWVGRLIGEEALAATANANIVLFLISSAAFGFGTAGTIRIGRRFGAGDLDGARQTLGSAVGFSLLLMVGAAVGGYLFAPRLLTLLGTPKMAYPLALQYLRLLFMAMPVTMTSIILAMGLRGTGDARTPLIFMVLTVSVDVVFNPVLITGLGPLPRLGIAGSALSTMLASLVSFVALVVYSYVQDLPLRLRGSELSYLRPRQSELGFIVRKGLPMGAQMLILSAAGVIIVSFVNREGLLTTAAYGASLQLFTYIQMPAVAVGGAVSAMTAQYIGAQKLSSLDRVTHAGVVINLTITTVLVGLLLIFDRPVLTLFLGSESPAVSVARHIQLLASWSFIFLGVTVAYSGTLRGSGAVMAPLISLAIAMYPARIGFYLWAYQWLGADAIWLSFPFSSFLGLALVWSFFRYSNSRKNILREGPTGTLPKRSTESTVQELPNSNSHRQKLGTKESGIA